MRVLLDVSSLDHEQISGVGIYTRHLLHGLAHTPKISVTGSWKISRFRKRKWIQRHCELSNRPFIPGISKWNLSGYDIFHGPDFRVPESLRMKKVVSIHDLAFYDEGMTSVEFAQKRRQLMEQMLKQHKPDAILSGTDFTRNQIAERFPDYATRSFTAAYGADHLIQPKEQHPRPLTEPYFLFVGNLEARKNIVRILKAFEHFAELPRFKDYRLVLIGKPGFGYDEIEKTLKSVRVRERVVRPGFVSSEDLVAYYQNAEAFAFPSLHEGFGFPILEAMRLRCPVISANTTGAGEVAGDAALTVDPTSVEEIASAMSRLAEDKNFRSQLIEKGAVRGRNYTWSDCAKKTAAIYQIALSKT